MHHRARGTGSYRINAKSGNNSKLFCSVHLLIYLYNIQCFLIDVGPVFICFKCTHMNTIIIQCLNICAVGSYVRGQPADFW